MADEAAAAMHHVEIPRRSLAGGPLQPCHRLDLQRSYGNVKTTATFAALETVISLAAGKYQLGGMAGLHQGKKNGGESEIRTHERASTLTVFETVPFDHSGISPL